MQHLLVMVATSTSLFDQSSWPEKLQNQASALGAPQIVVQSLAATERGRQARDHYTPLRAGWDHSSSETILVAGLSGRKPLGDFGCPA